ncbi:hypothetical protein D3C85_1195360 [compost metagenome]
MRHVAADGVEQEQRLVRARAADVDVLAEHRELLGEVAVQLGNVLVARRIGDGPVRPLLERMGAAAADAQVQRAGGARHQVAHDRQLLQRLRVVAADAGTDLDHRRTDLGLDVPRVLGALERTQQIRRKRRQVIVMTVHELEFQLHAKRQRLGMLERFERHQRPPPLSRASPA